MDDKQIYTRNVKTLLDSKTVKIYYRFCAPSLGNMRRIIEQKWCKGICAQLQWKHLNALESFAQALFCMSREYDLFWHGESMDRNHSACFRNLLCLLVGRSVGLPFGRTVRTSE